MPERALAPAAAATKFRISTQGKRSAALVAGVLMVTVLHRSAPTGSHGWHGWHLVAERPYYLPILLSAAWFPFKGAAAVTLLASAAYGLHVVLDWRGQPMVQAELGANVTTFWVLAVTTSLLFGRWKAALAGIERAHQETLSALAGSLELREPYTGGHSERVRAYTLLLADRLGILDPEERRFLAAGALFHDIGKIGIPDAILTKEDPLTSQEREVMKRHPELGAGLIGRVSLLQEARELVLSHHERFDGAGYPRGLQGEAIPRGARLFAVADAFDAMTTARSYRPALPFDEAARRIREGRGTQFDPRVVDAFEGVGSAEWREIAARHGVVFASVGAAPAREGG